MESEILINNGLESEQNLVYFISEDAVFPKLEPFCNIDNSQQGDVIVRIWSEQSLVYSENNRNDNWNGTVELIKQIQKQTIPIVVPDVRGGLLSIKCSVIIKDRYGRTYTITSNTFSYKIVAKQPVKKVVRELLNNVNLEVVMYKRSSFEQFNSNGEPLYDNGFGLYRIENPTVAEIWNWKMNAENAKLDYKNRYELVKKIPEKYRKDNPTLYKGLPDFSKDENELETLQSYGKGNYFVPKKQGLTRKWKWVIDVSNDGFANSCEVLKKRVLAGNLPTGWN